MVLVTLAPEEAAAAESLATLRFAALAAQVRQSQGQSQG